MDFGEVEKMLFLKELLDDLHGLRADLYDLSRDGEFHRYFTYENVPMINRRYERLLKMKKMLDDFDNKKSNKKSNNSNSKDVKQLLDKFREDFSKIVTKESIKLLKDYVEAVESKRLLPIVDSNDELKGYLVNLSIVTKQEIAESKFLQSYMKQLEDGSLTLQSYMTELGDGSLTKVEYYRRG